MIKRKIMSGIKSILLLLKHWQVQRTINSIILKNKFEWLKLDLGCGSLKRPGFIGIDLRPVSDIQWDITLGLPFSDNSISEIRSDHFFEHIELTLVLQTFKECHRVLKVGGILDFTIPHFDPYLEAYLNDDYDFLKTKIYDVPEGQDMIYSTSFDRIAWLLLRSGDHKSLFDRKSIIAKLNLAGFTNVKIREFDPNRDISQRFSSIYLTATK